MPISYRIDDARNLVRTTASGTLTDDDVLAHKRALMADPRFRAGMHELSDVRAVEELRVTPAGVRSMVGIDGAHADKLAEHKLAIVASQDLAFGTARMYQTLTEGNVPHVRVFRSLAEAAAWLGIASRDDEWRRIGGRAAVKPQRIQRALREWTAREPRGSVHGPRCAIPVGRMHRAGPVTCTVAGSSSAPA